MEKNLESFFFAGTELNAIHPALFLQHVISAITKIELEDISSTFHSLLVSALAPPPMHKQRLSHKCHTILRISNIGGMLSTLFFKHFIML